ncbi:peptidoglycan-binding protein [Nocardioides hungaricus]
MLVLAIGLVVAPAAGAVLLLRPTSPTAPAAKSTEAGLSLVTVRREDLTISTSLDGTLGYGSASAIPLQASGVVTWLPASGSIVGRGQTLLRVADRPIVLMYGTTPAYRAMYDTAASDADQGKADQGSRPSGPPPAPSPPMRGPDVEQLEQSLSALGYGGFTVDDEFTPYTAQAVEAWQSDLGVDPTGRVEFGDVVFLPGPVRVSTDRTRLGTADVSSAVKATATEKVVTVTAPAESLAWATEGARVSVALPNQKKVRGTVTSAGSQASGGGGGTVSVKIGLARPGQAKESGPVTVTYVSRREPNVLTVPVTALVALAEGGYGVQLEDGSYVPVTPGLYAKGVVQVTGDLKVGTRVRDAS